MPKPSPKINKTNFNPPTAIEVDNVSVTLGGQKILQNISFAVEQGSIAAVIGPNGSGKTTLIKAILGLVKADKGQITVLGQPVVDVRQAIGYVPQRFEFDRSFPITVFEFLNLARHRHSDPKIITQKIKEVGLNKKILTKSLGHLSGGQLQRILIAQAIINNPTIVFFDEPAAGIDVAGEAAFYDILNHLNRQHNVTIMLVSHDLTMVYKAVDQVICLNHKLMCAGPPRHALTEQTLTKIFGSHRALHEHHH